jgi:tetratricopeptide (TPR) repeat protein
MLWIHPDTRKPLLPTLLLLVSCALISQADAQITVGFEEPHNPVTMSVPDQPIALQIDLLHLKLEQSQLDQSATRRRLQASDAHGWVFSAFVYPLEKKQTALELSDEAFVGLRKAATDTGFKIEGVKTFARGEFSMREYIIPEFKDQPVHQKNVLGYATSGDMGIDFHISKISYSPADDKLFDALLNDIHLLKDYNPDGTTEFGFGSIYYARQDWARASAHYERALQLEKQKRALSPTQWNVLVDNLGMAYGMSGELSKSTATFEYGIKENPTYPMFRYNLACADAERGDLDGALEQLKIAFRYKSNSIPGEGIPDPAKDDSFKRYLTDPRFSKLTSEVCPRSTQTQGGWECR